MEPWETFRGLKQNLVCTKTQRPHRDWARPVFEYLLRRYRSTVACHRSRGSERSEPESYSLWLKPFWMRLPLTRQQSCQAHNPLTTEQLYQRNSHNVEKVLGPTTDFPTWGSGKGTENPPENLTLEASGIWLQNFYRTETQTLEGHKQNLVCTRIQEKGAVTPQETVPDIPVRVQKSLVEAWSGSSLLQGWWHWAWQCLHRTFWRRYPLSSLPAP